MQQIKNSYGRCQIIDLHMMETRTQKNVHFSSVEIFMFFIPLLILVAALCVPALSDMTFFAQCQNIPGGDVCSISFDKA
ncbi:MAG: hypothetical protein CL570_06345 [Alphaproteobacteria bacterium]|nr:hypothetical protein [Alphaproteobacteria bacterium]|tara:strand:+ start:6798 stop:7034 length:237 start_codon:yes stop_codon:yes gene_type:complete